MICFLFFETHRCTSNDMLLTVYTIQICKYKVVSLCDPLQDQEGMLSFKELTCWCQENVCISADGESLVSGQCRFTTHSRKGRGHQRVEKKFFNINLFILIGG